MKRREFLGGMSSLAVLSALSGCRTAGCAGGIRSTRGVVVGVKDLSGNFDWPKLAADAGLTTIGTHFGPKDVIPFLKSDKGKRFIDSCAKHSIEVEHELHALQYLLPRELFSTNPELFRMDYNGIRRNDGNCCVTNPKAIEIITEKAVEVARVCRPTTGRYYYWLADQLPVCQCENCRTFSDTDQSIIVENAIIKALRREVDPNATLSHLAYFNTLTPPKKVKPHEGLFLEYAPIKRWHRTHIRYPLVEGGKELDELDELLKVFPAETAQVLEYWLDESLFCGWRRNNRPLAKIPWNSALTRAEVQAYRKRGIRHFTTFAVDLSDEYNEMFEPDFDEPVKDYARILKEEVNA